ASSARRSPERRSSSGGDPAGARARRRPRDRGGGAPSRQARPAGAGRGRRLPARRDEDTRAPGAELGLRGRPRRSGLRAAAPGAASSFLLGTANFSGDDETDGRLHVERESGSAWPFFAWPEQGDRVTLLGSWVWDCDHYQGEGEHTELHPIRAIWVARAPSAR